MSAHGALENEGLVKLVYDAELKKMLGYIGIVLSTLAIQIVILLEVLRGTPIPQLLCSAISLIIWLAGCYFFIMAGTKFFELKQLETKLGIIKTVHDLSRDWNAFSKILHRFHEHVSEAKNDNWKRLSVVLDLVTILFILSTLGIFWTIQTRFFN